MVASESSPARVIMGAAAPADLNETVAESQPGAHREAQVEPRSEPQPEAKLQLAPQSVQTPAQAMAAPSASLDRLRSAVLQALGDGNQRILVSMLEFGEWSVEGNEVVIKVSESQTVVDMSLGSDARRLAVASASGVLGRAVKLKIAAGATVTNADKNNGNGFKSNATNTGVGGRGRAEQDAVVRRLQEKFGAEIRTVIDYKEKR